MNISTIPGASYALTCTKPCTVIALRDNGSSITVLNVVKAGQYPFVAPTDAVDVSDEAALVIQTFKNAVLGLSAQDGGIQNEDDAVLRNVSAQGLTVAGAINANGGVNIPSAVLPQLNGAATNNELIDYAIDRVMRTAPLVTSMSALHLKDYIDTAASTVTPYVHLTHDAIGLKATWVGTPNPCVLKFKQGSLFSATQDGPWYYYNHALILSAPTLLSLPYGSSTGALAQIAVLNAASGAKFGVRMIARDGDVFYEMFYATATTADEVVAVSERPPAGVNNYGGIAQPAAKVHAIAIYRPASNTQIVVKFGGWSMTVPYGVNADSVLEITIMQGAKPVMQYGAGISAMVATMTRICTDYQDQYVPTLNNTSYKS